MIVVDTNTIAYFFIPGEHTEQARAVLRKDSEWVAPLLWRSEFRNILASYLHRELLTLPQALRLMQEAENLMRGGEYQMASLQVLSLVASSGCSTYDCEFIALGQDLGVPVVTSDKKVLQAFPSDTIAMSEFVS
ncbi:MAG: type II toxin-antitoxin system VapC family toxin [Anaerolineae bacterium]|nr:type II toxin-antitoxin system VapC family toxin [Anaerolineae bacterium]